MLKDIHRRVGESKHSSWKVYLLAGVLLVGVGLVLKIELVSSLLRTIEGTVAGWDWLAILGIQGVLIGFVAEGLYEQGDRYAKTASHSFGSKDRTLFFRIGVMTIVSGLITKIVPPVLRQITEYLVLQSTGAVIVLGILLVHQSSKNWNTRTEWPAIIAGSILAILPSIV